MSGPVFTFQHAWVTPAPPERVYDVLSDVERYPEWWSQILAVAYVDEATGRVLARSLAPFVLDLRLTREREDPETGVLEVRVDGDLRGWCRFTLRPTVAGTAVVFEQQVAVTRRGLGLAARAFGPVLRLNHAWMMRGCRQGLAARLV